MCGLFDRLQNIILSANTLASTFKRLSNTTACFLCLLLVFIFSFQISTQRIKTRTHHTPTCWTVPHKASYFTSNTHMCRKKILLVRCSKVFYFESNMAKCGEDSRLSKSPAPHSIAERFFVLFLVPWKHSTHNMHMIVTPRGVAKPIHNYQFCDGYFTDLQATAHPMPQLYSIIIHLYTELWENVYMAIVVQHVPVKGLQLDANFIWRNFAKKIERTKTIISSSSYKVTRLIF